jgi:hypothetical protein
MGNFDDDFDLDTFIHKKGTPRIKKAWTAHMTLHQQALVALDAFGKIKDAFSAVWSSLEDDLKG